MGEYYICAYVCQKISENIKYRAVFLIFGMFVVISVRIEYLGFLKFLLYAHFSSEFHVHFLIEGLHRWNSFKTQIHPDLSPL